MKKLLSLILSVALGTSMLLGLASCSAGKKSGVIEIWWPGSETEMAAINHAKEIYEAENDVTIKVISQSTADFFLSYNAAVQTDSDYPDIAYIDHVYVQTLAFNYGVPAIANLSDYGADELKGQFLDSLWEPNCYQGDCYALPFSANTMALVYNKTLLAEVLGKAEDALTDADIPKTLQDMYDICDKVVSYNRANNTDYIPYTIPAGSNSQSMSALTWLSFVARNGGKTMSDDLKNMTLNNAACQAAAEALTTFGQKGVPSTFKEGQFESGQVLFMEMGDWKIDQYKTISETKGYHFGWTSVVTMDAGTANSGLGLYSLVATKKSPNVDIAVDFIKWLSTNESIMLEFNTAQNLMPTLKTALDDDFYTGEVWEVYKTQLANAVARPGTPEWAEFERQYCDFVTDLLAGNKTKDYLPELNAFFQMYLNEIYED